jgi:hypothetical protein
MNRRQFLGSALAAGALGAYPSAARASVSATDLKFVFVFAQGGWDPTRVFAAEFDNPNVDLEPDADRATAGGLTYVDHGSRPSVRAFMDAYGDRSLFMNGVLIRSIAHEICTMIMMTGTTSGLVPDWPAILAGDEQARFTLPHLVMSGPSYPGDLGTAVARTGTGGQLEGLLSGRILQQADVPTSMMPRPQLDMIDRYVASRAAARVAGATSPHEASLLGAYQRAVGAATHLKDFQYAIDFAQVDGLARQAPTVVDVLRERLSRCITLGYGGGAWDTHVNNDADQAPLWEGMFQGLNAIMQALQQAPGTAGGTSLADETVLVVMSEMARTPMLNGFGGKDHWPYGSVMITGPAITGGRVIGGYDENYMGLPVDPASGEVYDGGAILSAESVGATLLQMAGIDPAEHMAAANPIVGALASP